MAAAGGGPGLHSFLTSQLVDTLQFFSNNPLMWRRPFIVWHGTTDRRCDDCKNTTDHLEATPDCALSVRQDRACRVIHVQCGPQDDCLLPRLPAEKEERSGPATLSILHA